jgi:hypothetical protein
MATPRIWYLPVVEEFDHGRFHCRLRTYCDDEPDAKPKFYQTWSLKRARRQHGSSDGYNSLDECRTKLVDQLDKLVAAQRRDSAATRERRKAARIAEITREYLVGRGIGNVRNCAICNKELTDEQSIARGLGSECWPNFQDHLAGEVPRCQETIDRLRADIATTRARLHDTDHWAQLAADNPYYAERERERTAQLLDNYMRELADVEALQAAARKYLAG